MRPREALYSKINLSGISDNDYGYVQQIWNRIKPEDDQVTLSYYHDTYLYTDVLLLVFENFWVVCLNTYTLDLAHFYTFPGPSWKGPLVRRLQIHLNIVRYKNTSFNIVI